MDYIETSAYKSSNVEKAFQKLYDGISKKVSKNVAPPANVVRLDKEGVASETVGVASEAESSPSETAEEIPPWAEEMMKELQSLNSRLGAVEKLGNTVASMSTRLDELEIKMSKFDGRKLDFKTAQAKSVKRPV